MRVLLLTLIALLAACGTTPPPLSALEGSASYRERIALQPGSVLTVTLEDVSRADAPATVLGTYKAAVTGQVPLAFSVLYDPADIQAGHRYSLRAQLRSSEGALLFTSDTHIPVLGESDARTGIHIPMVKVSHAPHSKHAPGRTLFFECNEVDFMVRTGPGELALWLDDHYTVLSQVPAASGSQYTEGDISVWLKGDEAMLKTPQVNARSCRNNPQRAIWEDAKRRGVNFRATGNEPGWVLEIHQQQGITLLMNYGQSRIHAPMPEAQKAGKQTRYVTDALDVTLEHKRCSDTMADILYTTTVTVQLEDTTLRGCGNVLQ